MCLVDAAVDAATRKQPAPKPGTLNVVEAAIQQVYERADAVVAAAQARSSVGVATYGTPLQTFNGRDPLADLLQEQIDGLLYLVQLIYEWDDMRDELAALRRRQEGQSASAVNQLEHLVTANHQLKQDLAAARLERDQARREAEGWRLRHEQGLDAAAKDHETQQRLVASLKKELAELRAAHKTGGQPSPYSAPAASVTDTPRISSIVEELARSLRVNSVSFWKEVDDAEQ